jgi:bacterioferritin-associated ferredoxin
MIVCVCNNINEQKIQEELNNGARVSTIVKAHKCHKCAKCIPMIREMYQKHINHVETRVTD